MKRLMFVLVAVLFATAAQAQFAPRSKPKAIPPAATTPTPPPKAEEKEVPKPEAKKETETPVMGKANPNDYGALQIAYSTARTEAFAANRAEQDAAKAATGRAADSAETKAAAEAKFKADEANGKLAAAQAAMEAAGVAAFERGKHLATGERYMDGSDEKFPSILTADGAKVLLRECSYDKAPCNEITAYGLLMQLRHDLATPADIRKAYFDTAINIRNGDFHTAKAIERLNQSGKTALESYTSWKTWAPLALGLLILNFLFTIGAIMITRRFLNRTYSVIAILVLGALLGSSHSAVAAQTPKAKAATLKVVSLSPDAVLQDYTTADNQVQRITLNASLRMVPTVSFSATDDDTNADVPGIAFSDIKPKGNALEGKLTVDKAVAVGTYKVWLNDDDGNELGSGGALYVFDDNQHLVGQYFQQRYDGQIAALRKRLDDEIKKQTGMLNSITDRFVRLEARPALSRDDITAIVKTQVEPVNTGLAALRKLADEQQAINAASNQRTQEAMTLAAHAENDVATLADHVQIRRGKDANGKRHKQTVEELRTAALQRLNQLDAATKAQ